MRKDTTKGVIKAPGAYKQRNTMNVPRIVIITDKKGDPNYVTDDPKLEVYGVTLSKDGVWTEVYRRGPSIDRVWPVTLDRILGNAHEIGHYGDMAHILESLDRPKRKAKTRNAGKRGSQRK